MHVTDVETSLHFYVERLGFTCPWRYDEDGVAQVDRQGCALILTETWPEKIGKGLIPGLGMLEVRKSSRLGRQQSSSFKVPGRGTGRPHGMEQQH
jgi:catechol 2,3-dioxygenase-like lactoylglutathione lyase family enzyme